MAAHVILTPPSRSGLDSALATVVQVLRCFEIPSFEQHFLIAYHGISLISSLGIFHPVDGPAKSLFHQLKTMLNIPYIYRERERGFQPSQIGRKPAISQASTVRVNGRTAVSAPSYPGASLSLSSALRWMRRYLAFKYTHF